MIVGGVGVDDKAKVQGIDPTVKEAPDEGTGAAKKEGSEERRGQAEIQMSDLRRLHQPPRTHCIGRRATASRSSSSS